MTSERASVPLLLTHQTHSSGATASEQVNLFRGELDYPLELCSLTGPQSIELRVTAFYNSNVQREVNTRNQEAPSSPLGVGWSLPFDAILAGDIDWRPNHERSYFLRTAGNVVPLLRVRDDAVQRHVLSYRLRDHQPWIVRYDTQREAWLIIREDGTQYVYGGEVPAQQLGRRASQGGSVQWRVRWGAWVGSSVAEGGVSYPVAWNLSAIQDRWGNRALFEYDTTDIVIGDGPAHYTRDVRLARMVDAEGRVACFHYREKSDAERMLPHIPPSTLHAHQFDYPEHLLDRITVSDYAGTVRSVLAFEYDLQDASGTGREGLQKSYLTQVQESDPYGNVRASYAFTYDDPVLPGAIRRLDDANGSTTTYSYALGTIGGASAQQTTSRFSASARPCVWQGIDYTVVLWHTPNRAELTVHFWSGHWQSFQDLSPGVLDPSQTKVVTGGDFFALSTINKAGDAYTLTVYRRDERRFDRWEKQVIEPNLRTSDPSLSAGSDFLVVGGRDCAVASVYGWDRQNTRWVLQDTFAEGGSEDVIVAASNDLFWALHHASSSRILSARVYRRDSFGVWEAGGSFRIPNSIAWDISTPESVWSVGSAIAALTYTTAISSSEVMYDVVLLRWDEAFQVTGDIFPQRAPTDTRSPFAFSSIGGALVGNGVHLFRFDGARWHTLPPLRPVLPEHEVRLAYGSDVVASVVRQGDSEIYELYAYDPYNPRGGLTKVVEYAQPASSESPPNPSVAGLYSVLGNRLYTRTPQGGWVEIRRISDAKAGTIRLLPDDVVLYESTDGVAVLFLRDGAVSHTQQLRNQRFHVPASASGRALLGLSAFVTFEGDELESAHTLHLYRVLNASVMATAKVAVVSASDVNDGYCTRRTEYAYEEESATYDAFGQTAQYARASACISGGAFGRTEYQFLNGLKSQIDTLPLSNLNTNIQDHFSLLRGQIFRQAEYDATGRCVGWFMPVYGVRAVERSTLIRTTEQIASQEVYLFELAGALRADLDSQKFTSALQEAFGARAIAFRQPGVVRVQRHAQRPAQAAPTRASLALTTAPNGRSWWSLEDRSEALRRYEVWEQEDGALFVFGGFVQRQRTEHNAKGQPSATIQHNTRIDGSFEERIDELRYTWEEPTYEALVAQNILDFPIYQRSTTRIFAADGTLREETVIGAEATTWKAHTPQGAAPGDTVWAQHRVFTWDGSGEPMFDHASAALLDATPAGWLRMQDIHRYSRRGALLAARDHEGAAHSTITNRAGNIHIADFSHADAHNNEATYYGFEPYEDPQRWRLGVPDGSLADFITPELCFAGHHCLAMPATPSASQGLHTTLRVDPDQRYYVLDYRIRAMDGDASQQSAFWTVVYGAYQRTFQAEASDGRWVHGYVVVDLEALVDGQPKPETHEIQVRFENPSGLQLWLDHLRLSPRISTFSASVYNPSNTLIMAKLGARGELDRQLHDGVELPIMTTSADGRPEELQMLALWRRGAAPLEFDPARPNANLVVRAQQDAQYTPFRLGPAWQSDWEAKPEAHIDDGRLVLDVPNQTLTWVFAEATPRFCVLLQVERAQEITDVVTVRVSDDLQLRRQPSGSWSLLHGDATVLASGREPQSAPGEWCVCVLRDHVMLFVGGHLILSELREHNTVRPRFCLQAVGRLVVHALLTMTDPIVGIRYTDNLGREIQTQVQEDRAVLVREILYDGMGRETIRTKTARFHEAALGYRPEFVRRVDPGSGVLDGEVAEAYSGQTEDTSDDGGYPYWRTLFEPSPLSRTVELGAPGGDFAVDMRRPIGERKTWRSSVASNVGGGPLGHLPPQQFLLRWSSDPNGVSQVTAVDVLGRTVALLVYEAGAQPGLDKPLREMAYGYDAVGHAHQTFLPNALSDLSSAGTAHAEPWCIEQRYDILGRLRELRHPDRKHPIRYLYNARGQLRFAEDPRGAEQGHILYWKYDRWGRALEEGVLDVPWNEEVLGALVERNDALPDGDATPRKRYGYDGGGPLGWAQVTRVTSYTPASTVRAATTVEERLEYDIRGLLVARQVHLSPCEGGFSGYRIEYVIDRLKNIVQERVFSDALSSVYAVRFQHDSVGRLCEVSGDIAGHQRCFARYAYDAMDRVVSEHISPNTPHGLKRRYTYNAPGWMTHIADDVFQEVLGYTQGGADGAAYFDGKIASTRSHITLHGANPQQRVMRSEYRYAYEGNDQLQAAINVLNPELSLGATSPMRYDANGNLLSLSEGATLRQFTYAHGTDHVQADSTTPAAPFQYDANGNLEFTPRGGGLDVGYDRHSDQTLWVQGPNGLTLDFVYDASRYRIIKRSGDAETRYARNDKGQPLIMQKHTPGLGDETLFYVYGPLGLLAVCREDAYNVALKDHLGSVRALYDPEHGVVEEARNYTPFGATEGAPYVRQRADNPLRVPFRFTGQEWDDEVGLYNCNARLYDPNLRRFQSIDGEFQFPTPYPYVGNSPPNLVDPSGNIAWFSVAIPAALGLLGAYIGGVKANRSLNPADWHFGDWTTWVSMGVTAISYALIGGVGVRKALASGSIVGATSRKALGATTKQAAKKSAMPVARAVNSQVLEFTIMFHFDIHSFIHLDVDIDVGDFAFGFSVAFSALSIGLRGLELFRLFKIPPPPPLVLPKVTNPVRVRVPSLSNAIRGFDRASLRPIRFDFVEPLVTKALPNATAAVSGVTGLVGAAVGASVVGLGGGALVGLGAAAAGGFLVQAAGNWALRNTHTVGKFLLNNKGIRGALGYLAG